MHFVGYKYYDYKTNKEKIREDLNSFANQEGDYLDQIDYIRFINKEFNSFEEAKEYLKSIDNPYDNNAVIVNAPEEKDIKYTKKVESLKEKSKDAKNKYIYENNRLFKEGMTSKLFTCKECGCKIPLEQWNSNICPVCRNDLRSNTQLKKIASLAKRYDKLSEELSKEQLKCERNASNRKKYWYVKFEIHC